MEAANWLAEDILAGDPLYQYLINGKREKTVKQWAGDIDKIHRIDLRPWSDINRVLKWARKEGNFWRKNILSGEALREKFSRLYQEAGGRRVERGVKPNEEGRSIPYSRPVSNKKNGNEAFMEVYNASMAALEDSLYAEFGNDQGRIGQVIADLHGEKKGF